MKQHAQFKIRILSIFIVVTAIILVSKLYIIQVVEGDFFKERADRQHVRPGSQIFSRGAIGFTDKSGRIVDAATLKEGYTIAINPGQLTSHETAYESINAIYPLEKDVFLSRASKLDDPYEVIIAEVEVPLGEKIEALQLDGVIIEKTRSRFYPGKRLGAHVLGFVGWKDASRRGQYGLEHYYESVLSRDESSVYKNFFSQIFSNIEKSIAEKDFGGEGDVILTIEPTVQNFITETLQNISTTYSSEQTGAIIMNPSTGEIYAMAALPDFDPNSFETENNPRVFQNPLVESVFEMGSIIKPLTMAAGLDSGAVTRDTTYTDNGFLEIDGARIENYDGKGRGRADMQTVLSSSLNTGVAFVVSRMGNEKFARYMRSYQIGEETGIDLPNEETGLIKNLESTRDIEYATASYGQGIALTPIGTVRALATLGNGGYLVTPHVAREVRYKFGLTKKLSYGVGKQVLKKETSEEITRMLVEVVDVALSQGKAKNPHYSVAAKTGTAQVANSDGKGYAEDRFLHSFFGYFPAYKPQFLIFFYTVNPRGVRFASETLTDPFLETTKFLISYYNIPPDR